MRRRTIAVSAELAARLDALRLTLAPGLVPLTWEALMALALARLEAKPAEARRAG